MRKISQDQADHQEISAERKRRYQELKKKLTVLKPGMFLSQIKVILWVDNYAYDGVDQSVIFEDQAGRIIELTEGIEGIVSRYNFKVGSLYRLTVAQINGEVQIIKCQRIVAFLDDRLDYPFIRQLVRIFGCFLLGYHMGAVWADSEYYSEYYCPVCEKFGSMRHHPFGHFPGGTMW